MLTGLTTIVIGVVLGLLLVVVTDFIWPPKTEAEVRANAGKRNVSADSDGSLPVGATAAVVNKNKANKKKE